MNNKLLLDSANFTSTLEKGILKIDLKDEDVFPIKENAELIKLGGWLINVTSTIHNRADTNKIVQGWIELNEIVSVNKLFESLFFSTIIDFYRYRAMIGIAPHWNNLLRLCYWYHLNNKEDTNFDHKKSEIRRKFRRIVKKIEPTMEEGWDNYFKYIPELRREIVSATNELMYASLSNNHGFQIKFHKDHDFLLNDYPAEVKTLFSSVKISREEEEIPNILIKGMSEYGKIDLYEEVRKFIKSKKVLDHIKEAINQGGKIIFLDVTNTFFGSMFLGLTSLHKIETTFCASLQKGYECIQANNTSIIFSASAIGFNHETKSFLIDLINGEL